MWLAVRPGTYLQRSFIADDDVGLATARLRLLGNEPLRRALTDRAEAPYGEQFQWSAIRERAAVLAYEVASGAPPR
jgi:hypothetical protein